MNNAFDSVNVNSVYEIKVKINNLRDKLPGPSLQTSVSMARNKVSWKIGCNDLIPTSVNADFLP